jgi:hypothetical protein
MNDGSFQEAYARVRSRYDDQAWIALTPRQITEAIYQEIRLLDAERHRNNSVVGAVERNDSNH